MNMRALAVVVVAFSLSASLCAYAEDLPDTNSWFIQQLASGSYIESVQVSDTYVVWEERHLFDGTFYYDGTGIYELKDNNAPCFYPSLSGSSIVCVTSAGILQYNQGSKRIIQAGYSHNGYPDVYGSQVVWQAGPSFQQTNIYYDDGNEILCLTDNEKCFYNGKKPRIAGSTIAWLSHDGHDHEVFIMENGVIRQLTNNDADVYHWGGLHLTANGHLGWTTYRPDGGFYAHYYDGTYIRQLTVGNTHSSVITVFEGGVLYISNHVDDHGTIKKLMLFNGTDTVELYQTEDCILGAAAGGHSIVWIGRQSPMDEYRLYFLKGDELIVQPTGIDDWYCGEFYENYGWAAVWGNRLVWPQGQGDSYFGYYLGSPACVNPPRMDATGDCKVTLADFAVFASEWLSCGYAEQDACW